MKQKLLLLANCRRIAIAGGTVAHLRPGVDRHNFDVNDLVDWLYRPLQYPPFPPITRADDKRNRGRYMNFSSEMGNEFIREVHEVVTTVSGWMGHPRLLRQFSERTQ